MITLKKNIVLLILTLFFGCAASSSDSTITKEEKTSEFKTAESSARVLKIVPKTLAILPFENNSVTDADQYAPLSKGLSAMLTTDLSKTGTSLKLIERSKIESLLKETAFGQMGGVDESTAIKAGKILGAEAIAFGSFIVLANKVRIDTRIIGVETSEVIMAESIMGDSENFMELVQKLGSKIAGALKVNFKPETVSKSTLDAALYFSKGLEALDQNNKAEAEKMFQQSIRLDPAYKKQVETALNSTTTSSTSPASTKHSQSETTETAMPGSLEKEAGPNDKIVQAEGISSISKEDAIRQAQRSAVEQAIGIFVKTETEVENLEVKKDKIFSQTEGYIKRFVITKDSITSDLFNVQISALVSLNKIKDDLMAMKILLESMERPKLMILIDEEYTGFENKGLKLAETEMTSLFKSKGFELVDSQQLDKIKNQDKIRLALSGNVDEAKTLGWDLGAQYVILGKAMVQDSGEYQGTGMKSIQATLQTKIIQTQSGLILGSDVQNGIAVHISSLTGASLALKKAAEKSADDYLIDKITHSFQDFLNNGAPIKLNVTGITTFQYYKKIADIVEVLDKVVSSKKEGWNKASGILNLDLRFKGTSEELAGLLDGKQVDDAKLEVVDFAPDRLDCNLR